VGPPQSGAMSVISTYDDVVTDVYEEDAPADMEVEGEVAMEVEYSEAVEYVEEVVYQEEVYVEEGVEAAEEEGFAAEEGAEEASDQAAREALFLSQCRQELATAEAAAEGAMDYDEDPDEFGGGGGVAPRVAASAAPPAPVEAEIIEEDVAAEEPAVEVAPEEELVPCENGYVFVCSNVTEKKCEINQLMGAPDWEMQQMQKCIKEGGATTIFLFNLQSNMLYGPLKATCKPRPSINWKAFDGKFTAQVGVGPECEPTMMAKMDARIKAGPKTLAEVEDLRAKLFLGEPLPEERQRAWSKPQTPGQPNQNGNSIGKGANGQNQNGKRPMNSEEQQPWKMQMVAPQVAKPSPFVPHRIAPRAVVAKTPLAKPALAKPTLLKPALAKPALAKSPVAKPAVAQPAVAKPVIAKTPVGAAKAVVAVKAGVAPGKPMAAKPAQPMVAKVGGIVKAPAALKPSAAQAPQAPPKAGSAPVRPGAVAAAVASKPGLAKAPVAKPGVAKALVAPGVPAAVKSGVAKAPLAAAAVAKPGVVKAPVAQAPLAKAPLAKVPLAKVPLAKAPVGAAPVAKLPLAKAPLAKVPLAKAPLAKAPLGKAPVPVGALPPSAAAPVTGQAAAAIAARAAAAKAATAKEAAAKAAAAQAFAAKAVAAKEVAAKAAAAAAAAKVSAVAKAAAAAAQAAAPVETFEVGEAVEMRSGEFEGCATQILSIDEGDITVLINGADVVVCSAPELQKAAAVAAVAAVSPGVEEVAEDPETMRADLAAKREELRQIMIRPDNVAPFLNRGRLVYMKDAASDLGWGILVSAAKSVHTQQWAVKVFVAPDDKPAGQMRSLHLSRLQKISKVRTTLPEVAAEAQESNALLLTTLNKVKAHKKFIAEGIPELDLVVEMKLKDEAVGTLIAAIAELGGRLAATGRSA